MDYFDSKVYKVKNYIDEINQEIENLKNVEYIIIIILLFINHRKIARRK